MPSRAYRRETVSGVSFSVLVSFFLLLSTTFAAGVAHQLHQASLKALKPPVVPQYLVMLVLDGAQPGYLHSAHLPNLEALRRQGVEYDRAWAGILESETPTGHAALSTGSTPARDGLLGFNWIKSDNDAVRLFDPNVVRQGQMERLIQQSGAPTIASLFKARYPKARVVAVSGHKYYAADPLGGPNADYILYYAPDAKNNYVPTAIPGHVPPASILNEAGLAAKSTVLTPGQEDHLAVKLALASFHRVRQQITLINLPEFDWPLGHVYGGDPVRAATLMQDFDRDLGLIERTYKKAGVLDKTLFVITADHGMAPLYNVVKDPVLDTAVTKAGTTSLESTYSTAGYLWLQNPALSQAVADNVVNAHDPHVQSVYYKVTSKGGDSYVRAGGLSIPPQVDAANQYLLSTFLGGNAPDVVAFCTDDAGFEVQGAESWRGNHGGAAWGSQHIPLLIAGVGVVAGKVSHSPARLEDIAPTVLALMHVKATGMQGTTLADAVPQPSVRQLRAQARLNRTLVPVVQALEAESRNEIARR